jgi:thiol-disulfide isomerase/thioredoxin
MNDNLFFKTELHIATRRDSASGKHQQTSSGCLCTFSTRVSSSSEEERLKMAAMDQHHMKLMERVGEGILKAAEAEEKALDAKLASIENLDEDDFEALRQRRKLELQKKMRQEQDWRQLGHGRYLEVADTKDFFNSAKKSQRVIAHFYRGVTPRCQIVDAHFEKLAAKHVETRFLKIDAEKNPFLVERLEVIVLPTIVLIKDGRTEHSIRGFDEFGGTDDFSTQDMAYVLSTHGMLNFELDRYASLQFYLHCVASCTPLCDHFFVVLAGRAQTGLRRSTNTRRGPG